MKTRKGYKVYPLTAAQKLHFYYQQYCPKKQVLNIGSYLAIQVELDFGLLKESVYEAYARCDSMRLRFAKDKDGTTYQYVVKKEERDIEFFDFTGWKPEDAKHQMDLWTEIPFEKYDSPQNRVVMIKLPDGFQGLYIVVDHMTMDAQALIPFFKDIIEIYSYKKYTDAGLSYPKEMASYIKQLQKDLDYEAGTPAKDRDTKFFEQLISSSEPIFTDINGPERLQQEREKENDPNLRAVTIVSDNVDSNLSTFHLESEPSARLMQFCEDHQISMTCLLLMGLRTYLQKENHQADVSLVTTVARRATLLEKRSGGTRIHCFPFRTIVPESDTFLEGLYKVRDGQNQLFRHANYDPVEYYRFRSEYFHLKPGQTYEPLSLTYQPLTLKEKGLEKLGDIQYRSERCNNGAAAHNLYLTVSHRSDDNGLEFCFEYQTGVVSHEKLEYIYYYLCKILFEGMANPENTVGEIIAAV